MRDTVRVKISSDAAGAITLTPVVVQELTLDELFDHMVGVCGKDQARIREVLQRGSLVTGASRLRWEGWLADETEIAASLARFPDPDPGRPLHLDRCVSIVLRAGSQQVPVPRAAAEKRRIATAEKLWDTVASLAAGAAYAGYSYREKGDIYRVTCAPQLAGFATRGSPAGLLRHALPATQRHSGRCYRISCPALRYRVRAEAARSRRPQDAMSGSGESVLGNSL